jgi:transposase
MPARVETPADFAEVAHLKTSVLCERYGVVASTIQRFRDRIGVERPPANRARRPAPDDLAIVSRTMGIHKLAKHYSTGQMTVQRWLADAGLLKSRRRVIMPDDFAQIAPTITIRAAEDRFGVCRYTIFRWEKATDARCIRESGGDHMKAKAKPKVPKPPRVVREKPAEFQRAAAPKRAIGRDRSASLRLDRVQRDMTRAGQAADHLRRLDPVRRCDAAGEYALTGDHWHFRGRVYDAAGIIERAERAGFDPDAWMRIAA